jgi:hypothetical protein
LEEILFRERLEELQLGTIPEDDNEDVVDRHGD